MRLYLASASPRRRELMQLAGIPFEVDISDAEETMEGSPEEIARTNALRKARAVLARHPDSLVLSADTVVYIPGEPGVLGKPKDEEDAVRMLRMLSGRENRVCTGVALCGPDFTEAETDCASVYFDPMTEDEIQSYVRTGEPMDKAGAYAVQGRASLFIRAVSGSPSCVIGLPMHLVSRMLKAHGQPVLLSPTCPD